jgi:transcriptional regulator GlxA family with amidase domain
VWTSAGVTAGIDLAVAMIAEDHGHELARAVAQELVVYYRRPGGQSQFSSLSALQSSDGRFDALLDHVRSNLQARLSVEDLAIEACMSPRHFAREFRARTGVTPAKAVERVRVEAARTALENGAASVQRVALECGFGDVERMRRSFTRLLGMPPSALRRAPQQQA